MAHIKEKHKKILAEVKEKFNKKPEWKEVARTDYSLCYDVRGRFGGYGIDSSGDSNSLVRNFAYTDYIDYLEQYVRGQYSRTVGSSEAWWNLSITEKFKKVYPNLVDEISESLQDREREIIDYMNEGDTKKQLFMSLKDYILLGFSFISLSYDDKRDKLSVKRIPFDKCSVIPSPKWDSISLSVDTMKTKADIIREMDMNGMTKKKGKNVPHKFDDEDNYKVYDCMIMETPFYDEKLKEEQIIRAAYIMNEGELKEPYYYDVMPYNKRSIVLLTNSNNPNDPITNAGMVSKIYAKVIELNEFKIQEKLTVLRHNSPPILGRSDVIVDEARIKMRRPSDYVPLDLTQANNGQVNPPTVSDSIVPLNTTLDPGVIFQHCITLDREIRATINVIETIATTSPPKGETATAWNIYSNEAQKVIQYATEDLENNHHRPVIIALSNILDSKDAITKISIADKDGKRVETEANDDIIIYKFTASTRYITNRRKLNGMTATLQLLQSTIGTTDQGIQDIQDSYNTTELIAMIHELSGTDRKLYKSVEEVKELKEERANMAEQMNQEQQAQEMALQQASAGGAGGSIPTQPTENLATSRQIPL